MGLMGPSWSWDEIQKKDAIMGELKKENDRVLDKQRKENNRVIKELNNNSSLSSSASSKRSDHSLTPDDYAFLHEYKQKESFANSKRDSAILASKNRKQNLKLFFQQCSIEAVGGWLFSLFLAVISRKIIILFIIFLILVLSGIYSLISTIIKYILLVDNKETRMLKNTDCYKQILKSMQSLNLDKIKMMEINSLFISVYDIDGKRTEYRYSTYNFPELPPMKHGILLGSLVYDLGLNKDYKFSCEINGHLKVENIKLIAKLEKEKKILEKQKLKEKNNAMKNGKTW